MDSRNVLSAAAAALLASGIAGAQPPAPVPAPSGNVVFFSSGAAPVRAFGGSIGVVAGRGSVMGEVVTGKPYTADAVTESTQTLADGNRIVTTNRARFFRDSQGRTRREQSLDAFGAWQAAEPVTLITINDPVADASYVLDPREQTARKLPTLRLQTLPAPDGPGVAVRGAVLPAPLPAPPAGEVRAVVREFTLERSPSEVPATGEAPPALSVAWEGPSNVPTDGADASAAFAIAAPAMPVPAPFAPSRGQTMFATVTGTLGEPPDVETEDLGEQVLEGVLARGKRTKQTIAAGAIGNERPIVIEHEEWYAEPLEAVVLRRDFDPRFGETTYRLINVDRSEPPPDLFAVPPGYTLEEAPTARTFDLEAPAAQPGAVPPAGGERRVLRVRPGRDNDAREE